MAAGPLGDDRREGAVAGQFADRAAGVDLDAGVCPDAVGQVGRHPGAEVGAADDEVHRGAAGGEGEGGLPGRVGAADDRDGLVLVAADVELGRRVPHAAGLLEGRPLWNFEAPVVRAGGGDHRAAADPRAVLQQDGRVPLVGEVQAGHRAGGVDPYAELERLDHRQAGQVLAADPLREAEVVFDAGALRGLAAEAGAVQQHGGEPLGRPVDGGGQPRRAGAHHDQVDRASVGPVGQAEHLGQRPGGRAPQRRTVDHGRREVVLAEPGQPHQRASGG
ncbi:hypothetical protein Psuf_093190 [Phytohabitans suffuscus]|uniref:Uncharacterized protein n=1 Tax=Phytohabitans suffuscus TaxID=624315 RepID=A0A6F8Z107_9ACTN|nr:hypothetical protein Psuf_093190 [Phytohabitans suffuscus]